MRSLLLLPLARSSTESTSSSSCPQRRRRLLLGSGLVEGALVDLAASDVAAADAAHLRPARLPQLSWCVPLARPLALLRARRADGRPVPAETERVAGEAVVYFASCLADTVGPTFCPPSLDVLAQFWLDRNGASVSHTSRRHLFVELTLRADLLSQPRSSRRPSRSSGPISRPCRTPTSSRSSRSGRTSVRPSFRSALAPAESQPR